MEAIRSNRLVVFAGAGVSMREPTKLPSFGDLATKVSHGKYTTHINGFPYDQLLGELEREGVPVKSLAAGILNNNELEPSESHKDIIKLFGNQKKLRIVTTNYDLMFEKACREIGITTKVYSNPAFPHGNNFEGIIHIHGDVEDCKRMVLTDSDLGNSYIVNGDAARFLTQLFNSEYTVLFIGYKYEDVVMRYFTRAFPDFQTRRRFIFIGDDSKDNVSSIGLTPVIYEESNYDQLYGAISKLAQYASRDIFSWQTVIGKISELLPKQLKYDLELESEINEVFKYDWLLVRFLEKIDGTDWLIYLKNKKCFDNLFMPGKLKKRDWLLLRWLINNFLDNDCRDLLNLFFDYKFNLNEFAQVEIISQLISRCVCRDSIATLLPFLDLYLIDIYQALQLLKKIKTVDNSFLKLKLIKHILTFSYSYDVSKFPAFISNGEKEETFTRDVEVHLKLESNQIYSLQESIDSLSEHFRIDLVMWMANQLIDLTYKETLGNEHINFNIYMSIVDTDKMTSQNLASYVRIMLYTISSITWDTDFHVKFVKYYIKSKVSILRRVSILVLSEIQKLSAKEKIDLIEKTVGLLSQDEKEEIFLLLKDNYQRLNDNLREELIDEILKVNLPSVFDSKTEAYIRYNFLVWLQKNSTDKFIEKAIKDIKLVHPEFEPRHYPEKHMWIANLEWVVDHPFSSTDEIKNFCEKDIKAGVDFLLDYNPEVSSNTARRSLISAITVICSKDYVFLINLYNELFSRKELTTDLWVAILDALNNHEYNINDQINEFIKFDRKWYEAHNKLVSDYLYTTTKILLEKKDNRYSGLIFEMITKTWSHSEKNRPFLEDDLPTAGLNTSPGKLALATINLVYLHFIDKDVLSYKLIEKYKRLFTVMLEEPKIIEAHAVIIGHLNLFNEVDKKWTMNTLLHYFDSDDEEDFKKAWQGYLLFSPRLNVEVLSLLESRFLEAISKMDKLGSYKQSFTKLYSTLIIYQIDNPIESFIPALFNQGQDQIAIFYMTLINYLKHIDSTKKIYIWETWLHQFLLNRIANKPVLMNKIEINNIIDLIIHLVDECNDVTSVIRNLPKLINIDDGWLIQILRKIYNNVIGLQSISISMHALTKITDYIFENKEIDTPQYISNELVNIVTELTKNGHLILEELKTNMYRLGHNIDFKK